MRFAGRTCSDAHFTSFASRPTGLAVTGDGQKVVTCDSKCVLLIAWACSCLSACCESSARGNVTCWSSKMNDDGVKMHGHTLEVSLLNDKSHFFQQLLKSAFVKHAHTRFVRAAVAAPADLPPLLE